jgi:hypothetical protein
MNHVVLVKKLQAVGQLLGKVPRDRCLETTILFHQQCAEVAAGTIIEHKRHKFWRLKGIAQRNNIRCAGRRRIVSTSSRTRFANAPPMFVLRAV